MFETRINILVMLLLLALAVVVGRLVELQVINGAEYKRLADNVLLRPQESLPCVRGRIFDRTGTLLVSDDPDWEICVDYDVLAMEPSAIARRVTRYVRDGRYGAGRKRADVEVALRDDIARMWADLARLSGESVSTLHQRAREICERVAAVRRRVSARHGFDMPVREENMPHAVVEGLDGQQQVGARQTLRVYPWVTVQSGVHRKYHEAASLAHILGRVARVSPSDLESDPFGDDPLRSLLPHETVGRSGVEYTAEERLRGARGELLRDREDRVIQRTEAVDGDDVRLTIRVDLQDRLFADIETSLRSRPLLSSGGAVVVLDIPTREVLALVSYPSYDPNRFNLDYDVLSADMRRMPLRFRAVSNRYAPGSIVKPLTCLAGLSSGAITTDTVFHCFGSYDPDRPGKLRCWAAAGSDTRMVHGDQTVEEAITHSCNVFMYHTGERMGVPTLCNFFDMVGFGKFSGTGLLEETRGRNPTPEWLATRGMAADRGQATNFAIGQGELELTPVQAANLMATYASGIYQPVALMSHQTDRPQWRLPIKAADAVLIRRGLYNVVNREDGTAFDYGRLDSKTGYAICGKTGSATVENPWPIAYRVDFRTSDGRDTFVVVPAGDARQALEAFRKLHPDGTVERGAIQVAQRWPDIPPDSGERHAHAWFAGYLQALDSSGAPDLSRAPRIAFAVLIEFGGSGGRVAGPVARRVAQTIIDVLGPDLDPDAGVPQFSRPANPELAAAPEAPP